jgi:restriction endonuclease S subunit
VKPQGGKIGGPKPNGTVPIGNKANENGKYPFYNCSILGHLWTDEYVYEDEVLIINKTNGSGKYKVYYNNGKFNISGGLLIFKPNTKICKYKYLLDYINNNETIFSKYYEGSDKKNINREAFLKCMIPIPSLQDQEKIIKDIEKIESEQSSYKKYGDMLQEQIDSISKVIENLAKNNKEELDSNSESESDNSSSNESESEDEKPKKKVVKKPVKKTTSKKKVDSSSSESDSEESEDEKPVKKVSKPVAKIPTKKLKK